MEKGKIIELTNALYKVTDLFPKDETLKFSIREKGNSVLSFFVILNQENLVLSEEELKEFSTKAVRDIMVLFSYFEIAEKQNWVDSKNFEILKSQYLSVEKKIDSIKITKIVKEEKVRKVKKEKVEEKEEEIEKEPVKFTLTNIQERVVTHLQDGGKVRPSEINKLFPDLTPRSIRRELRNLKERGIVVSKGAGKSTFYEMNSYY